MPLPSPQTGTSGLRGPGRPTVSEAQILAVAIELIDREGADALTLRCLAARLGGSTATLYRHFGSRSALIDAVIDAVLAEVDLGDDPLVGPRWPVRLTAMATSLFDVLERHRNVAPLMLERMRAGPSVMRIREQVLAVLLASGFTPLDAAQTYATVGRYVLGFGVQTRIDGRFAGGDAPRAPAGRYPATEQAVSAGPITLAQEFRFGLDMMLRGLQTRPLHEADPGAVSSAG